MIKTLSTLILIWIFLTFSLSEGHESEGLKSEDEPIGDSSLTISVDCSHSIGALVPFWRSVGYTPATYALRDDELENTLNIGSVPNRGITQVRIHYILDLLVVLGFVPDSSKVSGYSLDYDFGELDHAIDFLIANDLSPGYEIMGSPRGFPTLPVSFYQPFDGNGHVYPLQTLNMFRQLIGDILIHSIERYGIEEVESWHLGESLSFPFKDSSSFPFL